MIDFLFFLPKPQHPQYQKNGIHLRWRIGWLKGMLFRPWWLMREMFGGSRLRIGKRFCLQGSLKARGPGLVIIGDDCIVGDAATPFTHSPTAVIRIGKNCFINGTRWGCTTQIEIGDSCIIADVRIFDTDFHSIKRNRNTLHASPPASAPVKIENNVWLAAGAAVLKGVTIGENSVIGFGSVVNRSIPPNTVAAGNPAVPVGDVPL